MAILTPWDEVIYVSMSPAPWLSSEKKSEAAKAMKNCSRKLYLTIQQQ